LATWPQRPSAICSGPCRWDDHMGADGFAGERAGRSADAMPARTVARFISSESGYGMGVSPGRCSRPATDAHRVAPSLFPIEAVSAGADAPGP
jgi:hypothetical protein